LTVIAIVITAVITFVIGVVVNPVWEWMKRPCLKIKLYCNPHPREGVPQWKQLGIEVEVLPRFRRAPWTPNPAYGCWGEYRVTGSTSASPKTLEVLWNSEICQFDGKAGRQLLKRYQLNCYPGMNPKLARAVIASKTEGEEHLSLHSDFQTTVPDKAVDVTITLRHGSSGKVVKCATVKNPDCHCASFTWAECESAA